MQADQVLEHNIPRRKTKTDKYNFLENEMARLWKMKVKIVPFIVGCGGTVIKANIKEIRIVYPAQPE